jgi:hypothetical protein
MDPPAKYNGSMTLPNFLIIGAGRAGTTSLHHYLRQHPEVFMPERKEPSYFAWANGVLPSGIPGADWLRQTVVTTRPAYEALFAGATGARAIGETSPAYLASAEAPARIRAMIPDARLVAILRDPVERAHAQWLGLRRDGVDPAPTFEEALRQEDRRISAGWPYAGLTRNSFYHRLLSRYVEQFPPEQIRVCLFDELVADPLALMRDLFTFLGVDPGFVPDVSRRHGGTGRVRNPVLRALWTGTAGARRVVRPLVPQRWRDGMFAWITHDGVKEPLAPVTRARLVGLFRDDVLALQDMLGRDLSAWLR